MQLVAYGAQDIYLTGNPQITFFKVIYRRHTNFSMESIEQTFNGTADFGKKVTCTISRNGDLMYRVYLQVTLPEVSSLKENTSFRWLNWVGHVLVKSVEVEIGGQRMDKQYGDWLHIWNELTQTPGHQAGYANMVGNVPQLTQVIAAPNGSTPSTTLFIPLQFWFCRNPGLALPLIALQYHEVKINLEFRDAKDCYWAVCGDKNTFDCCLSLDAASLYVDYIYLDTDERRRFAQVSHEYLIEQVQFTGKESLNSQCNKVKLNFNHPCKEIIWVAQPEDNVGPCASQYGGPQWFNYTDALDKSYYTGTPSDPLGGGMGGANAAAMWNAGALPLFGGSDSNNNFYEAGARGDGNKDVSKEFLGGVGEANPDASTQAFSAGAGSTHKSITNPWQAAGFNTPLFDQGQNCTFSAKLQLNGHDRFSEREGRYFNLVQPYQHHTNVPATGINVYSFGLKPEEHQPSGTCNMSRIDNATLQLHLTSAAVTGKDGTGSRTCDVYVYATNYNVLRIMSGMGGLAYSN
jgi:hypothetical protein